MGMSDHNPSHHWFHSMLPHGDPRVGEIQRALAEAGVPVEVTDPSTATIKGSGIFVFSTADQACLRSLAALSEDGRRRVVAIATEGIDPRGAVIWAILAAGATDVIVWNNSQDTATDVALRLERWHEVERLVDLPLVRNNLIGTSRAWRTVLRQLVEMARFTDAPILITGETGTGKELLARLAHDMDARPDKGDLVVVDCTTVVPELSGSEFFGHEKGAFTGAATAREGAFALADGGTLFLDELGELPLGLQAQLLRAVQEGTYKRVGGNNWRRAKFRLVCATNRDLTEMLELGSFRRDFYYRVAGNVLRIPPLRERVDDIDALATHFAHEVRPDIGRVSFDPSVLAFLESRTYPGNVRDLRQLVARMCCRHAGQGRFTAGDIPEDERRPPTLQTSRWHNEDFDGAISRAVACRVGLKDIGRTAEEAAIRIALELEKGSLHRAAQRLGVTDRTIQLRRATHRESVADVLCRK